MIPSKPYVQKDMVHSPRELEVLADVQGYLIRTYHNDGAYRLRAEARTQDPEQCLAAVLVAKTHNKRLLVYAVGRVYDEVCLALVDEKWLRERLYVEQRARTQDGE